VILHNSPAIFAEIINYTAEGMGIPERFIEKDYWLTTVLWELSRYSYHALVVFKGGTSLSKAYGIIERFSEDVDLALIVENLSGNQVKSRIDSISKSITHHLPEIKIDQITSKGSRFRRTAHQYPIVTAEPLTKSQLRQEFILEINAFANPFPFELVSLESMVATHLRNKGRGDLITQFELEPFVLQVLQPTRTLAEKVLALARASYHSEPVAQLKEKIRHIYDLYFLMQEPEIQTFVAGEEFFSTLNAVQTDDAKNSEFQGEWASLPLASAWVYQDDPALWFQLEAVYAGSFSGMVYGRLPSLEHVRQTLSMLASRLQTFDQQSAVERSHE
jgi:hypothetical protein